MDFEIPGIEIWRFKLWMSAFGIENGNLGVGLLHFETKR